MSDDSRKSGKSTEKSASEGAKQPANVISIREVLKDGNDNLIIPAEKTVEIGPDSKEHAKFFHIVRIRTFQDLQELSLIPAALNEERVKQAIMRDNNEALAVAQSHMRKGAAGCGCHDEEEGGPMSYREQIRSVYNDVRKAHNPNFAQVMGEVFQTEVEFDSPVVAYTRGIISAYQAGRFAAQDVSVFKIRDITIGKNATMNVAATTKLVFANDIRIHVGGKMNLNSSFTKIKCSSIQGNLP